MTETENTINQDSSGADLASNNDKSFMQVYKSTDEVPCEVWFAPKDAQINRPFTQIPPDADMKNPKFDFINYKWFDLGGATQAQKLNSLAEKIESLQQDVADGKVNQEEINQNLGTLTDLVSAVAGTVAEEGAKDE